MTNLRNLRIPLAVAAVAITSVFVLSSWDFKNTYAAWNDNDYDNCDTIPKKEKKIRDLDDVLDELNGVDFKMDMEKMQKELNESMKKLDMKKIQLDMEKAMRDVDFEKIQKEMEQSMAKIDFGNIEKEMAKAMKEFDAAKIQKEVQESMQKVEWDVTTFLSRIGRIPDEIADALEAEARVENVERQHRRGVCAVAGRRCDPRRDRACFGDAFFENLAVLRLFVVEQFVFFFGIVQLADRRIDRHLPE